MIHAHETLTTIVTWLLVMKIKGSELCTKTDMSFSLENVSKNTHCLFCFHCVDWHLLTC